MAWRTALETIVSSFEVFVSFSVRIKQDLTIQEKIIKRRVRRKLIEIFAYFGKCFAIRIAYTLVVSRHCSTLLYIDHKGKLCFYVWVTFELNWMFLRKIQKLRTFILIKHAFLSLSLIIHKWDVLKGFFLPSSNKYRLYNTLWQ